MDKIINVPYEKIGFNANEISKMSLDEFKKHEGHHFDGDPQKDQKMTEAYTLIKTAWAKATGAETAKPDVKTAGAIDLSKA